MTHTSVARLAARSLRFALVLAAFAPLAKAQSRTVQVKVPFAFQNGTQRLPAGTYRIVLDSTHMLHLRGVTTTANSVAITNPEQKLSPPTKSTVVFHHTNGRYFLSEVWMAGNSIGQRCAPTRAEKQLQIGEIPTSSTNTEVALNVLPY